MKLKQVKFKDLAEHIDKNVDSFSDRIITNKEICDLLNINYFDDKVYQYAYALNKAFLLLKLRHRLFNIYSKGWELKSNGKHIKPEQIKRNRKLRNTLKTSINLYNDMALASTGREKQLLDAQARISEAQLQQFNAILSLDISLNNDDKKAIMQ